VQPGLRHDPPYLRALHRGRGPRNVLRLEKGSASRAPWSSTGTSRNGRAEQAALIYDSPVTGRSARYTYRELRDEVARFAGALRAPRRGKGDRVIIYMPMVPEAVIAMLACARLGAVHSVVFGGFAANELATRIDDAEAQG
jgi:acyl-coenzyme A synthetase/AMP-(fatty) acid ligase